MLRPRANEIPELVRRLGGRSGAGVDAARARLSTIGPRAVEHLIEALERDNNTIRARVMPLLALIQDPRAREPLIAMLLDRSSRLREIAARCLARFPAPESVAALNRVVLKDRRDSVRITAVRSLVEHYAAGQERAIRLVLELLADTDERPQVRLAAFALLPLLPHPQRLCVLDRLHQDPYDEIRRRAGQVETAAEEDAGPRAPEEIHGLVVELTADDYGVWIEAVQRVAACGSAAIPPLLSEMQSRAHDPEFCIRAGMALKAMGPHRCRALVDAMEEIEEPLPLQVLVEVIGALGEKALIYRLGDLIERLARRTVSAPEHDGLDLMQRVRAKAHLELARIGSRVAILDLREALGDPERRIELEMLAAVERIGKREEIGVLLRAWGREDEFMKERIGDVVRSIMKRERIRRNNRMFQSLGRTHREALEAILPRRRSPGSRTAAALPDPSA